MRPEPEVYLEEICEGMMPKMSALKSNCLVYLKFVVGIVNNLILTLFWHHCLCLFKENKRRQMLYCLLRGVVWLVCKRQSFTFWYWFPTIWRVITSNRLVCESNLRINIYRPVYQQKAACSHQGAVPFAWSPSKVEAFICVPDMVFFPLPADGILIVYFYNQWYFCKG